MKSYGKAKIQASFFRVPIAWMQAVRESSMRRKRLSHVFLFAFIAVSFSLIFHIIFTFPRFWILHNGINLREKSKI